MTSNHLLVGDIVNKNSFTIKLHETIRDAALLISRSQATDLMVIDDDNHFIGVLSEGDLVRAIIPNFNEFVQLANGTLANAYQEFLDVGHKIANQPINQYIVRNAVTLNSHDELLKVAVVMVTKHIRRLPVVDNGKLVGTVSRADVCQAIFGVKYLHDV